MLSQQRAAEPQRSMNITGILSPARSRFLGAQGGLRAALRGKPNHPERADATRPGWGKVRAEKRSQRSQKRPSTPRECAAFQCSNEKPAQARGGGVGGASARLAGDIAKSIQTILPEHARSGRATAATSTNLLSCSFLSAGNWLSCCCSCFFPASTTEQSLHG